MNRNDKKWDKEINNEKENDGSNNDDKANEKKESEGNVLDKLFFKTKTKPYIYYLPLTDEQVKQKLQNRNKLSS